MEPGDFERLDDLNFRGRKIIQDKREFCFGIDAVLLARFPRWKQRERVLDLGTGAGIIPLLIADEVARVDAVELNPTLWDLARRNFALNHLEEKIILHQGDLRRLSQFMARESFDRVIVNPPYRPLGKGKICPCSGVATARHELTATLADVVAAARYALRFGGRLAMVHLPERLEEIFAALAARQFAVKILRFVHSFVGAPAKLVLLEAVVGGKVGAKILPPLIIRDDKGNYMPEIYGN